MTPTQRLVTINAWSFSRYGTYTQCPRKAKYQVIDRLKEPDEKAPALLNGIRVHAMASVWATKKMPAQLDREAEPFRRELELLARAKIVPQELATFKEEFDQLRATKDVIVESQWTLDKDWNDMGPHGWFEKSAWLRIKVDLHYLETSGPVRARKTRVVIRDHKTGKFSPDHAQQRSLYALGALLVYPDAAEVEVAHWYLDQGITGPEEGGEVWTRGQLPALKAEWLRRTQAMLRDTTFMPNPTDKCRWCFFSKAKGGPCEF